MIAVHHENPERGWLNHCVLQKVTGPLRAPDVGCAHRRSAAIAVSVPTANHYKVEDFALDVPAQR